MYRFPIIYICLYITIKETICWFTPQGNSWKKYTYKYIINTRQSIIQNSNNVQWLYYIV